MRCLRRHHHRLRQNLEIIDEYTLCKYILIWCCTYTKLCNNGTVLKELNKSYDDIMVIIEVKTTNKMFRQRHFLCSSTQERCNNEDYKVI